MTSPFDAAGFTNVKIATPPANFNSAPQAASKPQTFREVPEADEFVPSESASMAEEPIDREAMKAELKEEIQKELAEEAAKNNKLGPIDKFKRFIGTIKKSFSTLGEYAKGTIKGIGTGAVIGSLGFTAFTLAKKPTGAKAAGIIGALAGLGVQLWNASLKANEQRAVIDHTWEKTPVVRK